ncbi:hypothetical protein CXG81DRAFT_4723, partial [Caulochytrium protostelioides]
RVLVELFADQLPETVEHVSRCVRGGYNGRYDGVRVTRVVRHGWVQTDAITQDIDGAPLTVPTVPDESFSTRCDQRGRVALANTGPHSSGSALMFLLNAMPALDRRYLVVGQCLTGGEVLDAFEAMPTVFERPKTAVQIIRAGLL